MLKIKYKTVVGEYNFHSFEIIFERFCFRSVLYVYC